MTSHMTIMESECVHAHQISELWSGTWQRLSMATERRGLNGRLAARGRYILALIIVIMMV
jgi:hypothetical protein